MATRLYVPPDRLAPGRLRVDGDDFHYLVRVLRLRAGAELELFDGAGKRATAQLEQVGDDSALLAVEPLEAAPDVADGAARIRVLLPLIKGERMSWCVQKLVELGVSAIWPVALSRCVVRVDGDKAVARRQRYESIARAAARQCRRGAVPSVEAIGGLEAALAAVADCDCKLVFWEGATGQSLRAVVPDPGISDVAVLVGPEGGLTPAEVDAAMTAGFLPAGLGPRILRAETAAVAAVAILGYELGDLG